jgi:two-component system response regulator AtoC
MMPNRDGLDTLQEIRRMDPDLPVIVVSGVSSTIDVVTAMKCGATDFLLKPVGHDDLQKAITRATQTQVVEYAAKPKPKPYASKAYAGKNPRMKEIYGMLPQLGWSGAPILIQGETGTGKEVIARELHALSPRADRPFLKLNCAALPSELVESELFGYERGAFTGAFQKKAGMFEMADGGTILLDEIGDMDVRLQAKLLQVLQDHEFQRIGGKEIVRVNVRVLAATHQDLEKAIAEGRFREDLFYRLNVINLHVPALRERTDDLMGLTDFLIERHLGTSAPPPVITPELKQAMLSHQWAGNVRELENFVRRLLILRDCEMLTRELVARSNRKALAAAVSSAQPRTVAPAEPKPTQPPILAQVTKEKQEAEVNAILTALNSTRWNRKRAASLLKIDYKALLYKMKRLGVEERAAAGGGFDLPESSDRQFSEPEIA